MSGLFNPFAEEDKEAQPSFNYYSDPLASFQPGAGRGTKPRTTSSGPRPPSGAPPPPQQHQQGRQQPPGMQRHAPPHPPLNSSIPPPRPPPGPPPNYHNQPGPPPMQPPSQYQHQQGTDAAQQGFDYQPGYGAPGFEQGMLYYGGPGGDAPLHKMQRTGPDTRFNQGRGRGGTFSRGPYQQDERGRGRGRGRGGGTQRDGWFDGSQPGRGFNHDYNTGGPAAGGSTGQGNMARYYKPSFSMDPWVGLLKGSAHPAISSSTLENQAVPEDGV